MKKILLTLLLSAFLATSFLGANSSCSFAVGAKTKKVGVVKKKKIKHKGAKAAVIHHHKKKKGTNKVGKKKEK